MTEGKTTLFLEVKVRASEMASWDPQRIINFFCGIAQAISAAEGKAEVIVPPDLMKWKWTDEKVT